MKNRLLVHGMLVLILASTIGVIGCDNGTKDDNSGGGGSTDDSFEVYTWTEADIGTNITSLMQLNGTWKGSYTHEQAGKVTVYYTITGTNADSGEMSYVSVTSMAGGGGSSEIRLSDISGVQINQDGTKIKVPAGILRFPSEIILKKYTGSIPDLGIQVEPIP
jgi:hypothetical protein